MDRLVDWLYDGGIQVTLGLMCLLGVLFICIPFVPLQIAGLVMFVSVIILGCIDAAID